MNKEGNLQTYGFDSLMWMFGVNPPSAIDVKDNKPKVPVHRSKNERSAHLYQ